MTAPSTRGLLAALLLLACMVPPALSVTTEITFETGSFTKHPCSVAGTQCDTDPGGPYVDSFFGKSRSVSFKLEATWVGSGTAETSFCFCRLRANMNGFDDPLSQTYNPTTASNTGVSASGGALSDSKLEPWGAHWYRCWDQNSDVPPPLAAKTNAIAVTGPSDAPFINLPDGYYHFSASCTEDNAGAVFFTADKHFKIDNVAPESTITPYVAPLDSSLTGSTGIRPSYDPAAFDHRLRYKKASGTNPTNLVLPRLFDFKLSVKDYHGSVGVDTTYDPYGGSPVASPNTHGVMNGKTFYAELERIKYECKIDSGDWASCDGAWGTRYQTENYGHWYFSEAGITGTYSGMASGNRFITTKQLAAGTHVLMVRATDLAGNTEMPTMYSFYVAPYTTGGYASGCSFGTKLTSNNVAATYTQTAFDLTTDTKVSYSDLIDGDHTLTIFAKDDFGLETAVSGHQSVSWTVDRTAPAATLTKSWVMRNTARDGSYVSMNGAASRTDAIYEWAFSNTTTMTVPTYSKYSIDNNAFMMDGFVASSAGTAHGFTTLSMPPFTHQFNKGTFSVGTHSVSVKGVDYVGNEGTPATETFTVEELDTLLNCDKCAICDWSPSMGCHSCQDISSAYVSDSITFDIGAKTDGSSIRFKYDYIFGDSPTSTSFTKGEHIPEFTVRNIGEGKYYVMAKGRTLGGTYDATPSCVMLSTDLTRPVTTINSELKRINNLARMPTKVAGTVVDANWKYDGLSWRVVQMGASTPLAGPATSAQAVTGASAKMLVTADPTNENVAVWELDLSDLVDARTLGEGKYMLVIYATDKAGHRGTDVSYDWMIDMGPPDTHVVNGPAFSGTSPVVTLTFACEESGDYSYCSYKYRSSPSAAWTEADCNLDRWCRVTVPSAPGVNTLEVKAVDLAGNEDASSQYYTWMMYDTEAYDEFRALSNFTTPWSASRPTFPMPDKDEVQVRNV